MKDMYTENLRRQVLENDLLELHLEREKQKPPATRWTYIGFGLVAGWFLGVLATPVLDHVLTLMVN